MRLFGDANVPHGSLIHTRPLRLNISIFSPPAAVEAPPQPAAAPEFDEDGRLWVFRFPRSVPRRYSIDRDRLFAYAKKHRFPTEGERRMRRDWRNCADFYTEIRELQTHPDVEERLRF